MPGTFKEDMRQTTITSDGKSLANAPYCFSADSLSSDM
jgi:hypothetical protein